MPNFLRTYVIPGLDDPSGFILIAKAFNIIRYSQKIYKMKNKVLIVAAVLIALIGIVWFGQGIGAITGSVMTDDSKWAFIGAAMVVAAAALFWFALKRRSN